MGSLQHCANQKLESDTASMNRRTFGKKITLGLAGLKARWSFADPTEASDIPTLYYADGYHGGIVGHMPMGSWRDILNALRDLPEWKLSLDIEPNSWAELLRRDPEAFSEMKSYLADTGRDARIEMVGCTFAQPYGWAIGGESNIRQLQRGCQVIRHNFQAAELTTYAVQEPCWSSCLPQILASLGFTGAVLRDPSTAWGGYSEGFDAELVNWIGPDGTPIAAVPRYACEALQKVYETESVDGSPEFARKCVAHGIPHPAGMCFQDLGWPAKPKVSGSYIQYVIWREYIHTIADKPTKEWHFGIEDILTTLPWGEHTLQEVAQEVRSAENRMLMAEKMAAMAHLECGKSWPDAELRQAWDNLLLTEAHDAWITATTRRGRQAWAFQVASETLNAEDAANAIIDEAAEALSVDSPESKHPPLGSQWLRVMNTLGATRRDLVEVKIATDRGTRGLRLFDASSKEVPCQVIPTRRYLSREVGAQLSRERQVYPPNRSSQLHSNEGLNAATLVFRPEVGSLGHASYRLEPVYSEVSDAQPGSTFARVEADGSVTLESDLYRMRLDPARGGIVSSLYAKQLNKEFCDPASERLFNEYRGYFMAQKEWRTSASEAAKVTIIENGPLRARVRMDGQVGGCPFQTMMTLVEGQRRIDVQARFTFEQDTWIGDPWDMKPEDRRREQHRSQNDGRWKLQACFPVSLKNQAIYKNAAYDVCRSRNVDTFFQRWDEIKHNIVVNWVDVLDEKSQFGVAILSDHTTAYTHGPDFPLSLVLAWGGEGGFWWGKCPLRGTQQVNYGIVPHSGAWDQAGISQENARFCEPLIGQIVRGVEPKRPGPRSLIQISGEGIEIPTTLIEGKKLFVRLFNAEGDGEERTLSIAARPQRVYVVELNGRSTKQLRGTFANGRHQVKLAIPRFGIRTVCYELPSTTS
jgi:alpha-mannosidase